FKEVLQNHKDSKMVVFTESKQTALYLEENLKEFKILCVHGGNRDKLKDTIRENFDANYESKKQKNEFNVIITTDTLSEGVNMHRSNIIYNYDIPWNSTRLMQRIGRINRIGTKHDTIYVNNFVPSAGSDALIELSKKAFVKLQTFHSTFGEDNQIYSKNEEVESVTLFEELSEDLDEELSFLEEIREYKNANPKKFKALKKLPAKIRVQRDDSVIKNATFVFIKNENSKSYYFVQDEVCHPVNFIEMAKQLKVSPRVKDINPLKELHYEQVESAMQSYTGELSKIIQDMSRTKVENPTDKKAINLLKGWRKKSVLDKELVKIFISIIEDGRIQNMGRKIKALEKKSAVEVVKAMELLQDEYSLELLEDKTKRIKRDAQVILSETFLGK
ncbi:MAG: C-terminal helicase domain-containing protein, partial [Campylobacterota bacterium]|nr:C-terminal helicase domain-containing protein [Campylobacterota bacterium]